MLPPPPRPQQKAFAEQWNTETPLALKPINQVEVWANHDLATATGLLHPPSWISPPHPPPPPSEHSTARGPKGRSCDAPVFQLSELVGLRKPPSKLLGKGQVCKAQDPKSWGKPQRRSNASKALTSCGADWKMPRPLGRETGAPAGPGKPGTAGPPGSARPPHPPPRAPERGVGTAPRSGPARRSLARRPRRRALAALQPPGATRGEAASTRRHASCHHITANRHQERRAEGRAGEGGEQPHAAPQASKKRRDGATSRWSPRGTCPVRTKRRSLAKKAGSRPQNK